MSNKKLNNEIKVFVKTFVKMLNDDQIKKVKKAFIAFEKELISDKVDNDFKLKKVVKTKKDAKVKKVEIIDQEVKLESIKKVKRSGKIVKRAKDNI